MTITYRKLNENDFDVFIKMRINQLREEGAKEDIDLTSALRDYLNEDKEANDPRKYMEPAKAAMKAVVEEKIKMCLSNGRY